jgi:hypothetical protein
VLEKHILLFKHSGEICQEGRAASLITLSAEAGDPLINGQTP